MPKKKKADLSVGEEVKIAVDLVLEKFMNTIESKEYEFPSSLTAEERAYIHELAREFGLKSKSRGKRPNRFLTVYKREGSSIVQADAVFSLSRSSRQSVSTLIQRFPVTNKERQDLLPLTERDRMIITESKEMNKTLGRLMNAVPQVPSAGVNIELLPTRKALPIWPMANDIVSLISKHQVILLVGETGSGKTTQVPQFILDQHMSEGKPCRIICTQPRRLSTVSVSERVAIERDEKIGVSVGYQIRLESRISPKTVLTYCTDGVLLRTLMGGDSALATVTHIIVDEIHERSRFTDFLLVALRDALSKFRSLHLILMSATVDSEIFVKYFNHCPVLTVTGRQFEVQEYFLEHILKQTKYMSKGMIKAKAELQKRSKKTKVLEEWTLKILNNQKEKNCEAQKERKPVLKPILGQNGECVSEKTELDGGLAKDMDECMYEAWLNGTEDAFTQLLYLINSEHVSVDYQHSETGMTCLMIAVCHGYGSIAEQLLGQGANIHIRSCNDWTALDWAQYMKRQDMVELLEAFIRLEMSQMPDSLPEVPESADEETKELLNLYHHSFNDDNIDMDLLMVLLTQVHSSHLKGAILVFLPGYEDIVNLRDRILSDEGKLTENGKFRLYILHSKMQTSDQKLVFRTSPPGVRKIILSTSIAETSITIDDVVFVIDSGKVKEKSVDVLTGTCSLRPYWISQACAKQRKGRAGRTQPGICYHMFSSTRFNSLQKFHTPEILRLPIYELCLQSKMLAPPNTPIVDFLSRVVEAPSYMVIRNAVQVLKAMDALDAWEDLTELGQHLLELPVDPHLGKMILYSLVLKCLDPVLTIVCSLAHRDPFILPLQPDLKRSANVVRKKFASGSFSDHMALLRAFQAWQQARNNGSERSFCNKHFISSPTMEMVVGMRSHILGQLRALGFIRARGSGDIRDLNSNSENWAVVKAALCAGAYPNLVRVDREHAQLRSQKVFKVEFHPSSVLREGPKAVRQAPAASHATSVQNLLSDWLFYEEMSRSGNICHIRTSTLISPITVAIFSGPVRLPLESVAAAELARSEKSIEAESDSEVEERPEGQSAVLKLDEWVVFHVDSEASNLALHLRQKWNSLFIRRMKSPSKPLTQVDEMVLKTVVAVLTAEEQALGLPQPSGIGQRPRAMTVDTYSPGFKRVDDDDSRDTSDSADCSEAGSLRSQESNTPSPTPSQATATGAATSTVVAASPAAATDAGSATSSSNRYFIIKAGSAKAIEASIMCGVWAFTPNTEKKVLRYFKEGKRVFLVYSVQGSGHFQGYSQLMGDKPQVVDMFMELIGPSVNAPLPVEWIKQGNIPFQVTRHLLNPLNENKRVQTSRDGQEIEPNVGEALCLMWDKIPAHLSKPAVFSADVQPRNMQQGARAIRGFPHPPYNANYQHYVNHQRNVAPK